MSKIPFVEYNLDEDPIPSYEESIRSASLNSSEKAGRPLGASPLHRHLDEERLRRVQAILTTYIDPLLVIQGTSGLYKTIFLLVPSNVHSLQTSPAPHHDPHSPPKEPEILGFASTDVVKLIRLSGGEHTVEFWRQPAVLAELSSSLKARLAASGHRVEQDGAVPPVAIVASPSNPPPSPPPKKSSFWGRSKDKTTSKSYQIEDLKLGWRADHEEYQIPKPRKDEVRVIVQMKEICLRVENQMGLYETCKGQGICLSIEVGH